jgi:hypothetical protein
MLVPEHKGMDGIETADESARQGSSHPLTGLEVCSGTGQAGNMRSIASPFMNNGGLRVFLKEPWLKELGNYSN